MDAIRRDCPIECLAPLLPRQTMAALTAGMGSPATVGQVVELYEQRKLMEIYGISTGRLGEIRRSLVKAGLIEHWWKTGLQAKAATRWVGGVWAL
jgi:hypothetical protein